MKPIGRKNYGSIGHLPNSKLGPADHKITDGQARILTEKTRDKNDYVIITEKVDGSNVGIAKKDGKIHAINRSGYNAATSPYEMHHKFAEWVDQNKGLFSSILSDGQRLCGEWMYQAHGLVYDKLTSPFIAFDLMEDANRLPYSELTRICRINGIEHVACIAVGPKSTNEAFAMLGSNGFHGCSEKPEGLVYRVERNGVFDFAAKWVRPDMTTGQYLKGDAVLNSFAQS